MTHAARGHNGPTEFLSKRLTVWRDGYGLADLSAGSRGPISGMLHSVFLLLFLLGRPPESA